MCSLYKLSLSHQDMFLNIQGYFCGRIRVRDYTQVSKCVVLDDLWYHMRFWLVNIGIRSCFNIYMEQM